MDIEIEHISISENDLAKRNLAHLREVGIRQPVLAVFDCGYFSIEFIDFLEMEGTYYLIRFSFNDYKAECEQMQSVDDRALIKYTFHVCKRYEKNTPNSMNI